MKTVTLPLTGMMILGLAACGGGGGGGIDDFVLSSGILELELPTDEERESFSVEQNALIDEIQAANESPDGAVTPDTDLVYEGTFGAELDSDGTLLAGDVIGSFDVTTSEMGLTFSASGETSDPDLSVSGSFSTPDMLVTDGTYSGLASGSFHVTDSSPEGGSGSYSVTADIVGATVASGTFGSIEGDAVSTELPDDTFGGLFIGEAFPADPI